MDSPYHERAFKVRFDYLKKPTGWRISIEIMKCLRKELESVRSSTFDVTDNWEWLFMALPVELTDEPDILELK